jgi:hypothetical protein
MNDATQPAFRKSSHSGAANGNCVEVAVLDGEFEAA